MLRPSLLSHLYISHNIITRVDYRLIDFILLQYFYGITTLEQSYDSYPKEEDLF